MLASKILITLLIIFYFVYTLKFSITFYNSLLFKGYIKAFHMMMFWIVPFIWIFLISNISKSTQGSYEIEKKEEPIPYSDPYAGP